jgi:hypothetical protein
MTPTCAGRRNGWLGHASAARAGWSELANSNITVSSGAKNFQRRCFSDCWSSQAHSNLPRWDI